MRLKSLYLLVKQFAWIVVCSGLLAIPARGQSNLSGVIDIHAHMDPDSMPRSIDAIDLAKLAKQRGMRGLVLKNHYESTAALAYIVRKEVPGIEIFGGIDLNRSVGGINPAAIERMVLMKGGWGKVVWMPTFDSENQVRFSKENRPFVSVAKDGQLLPEVEQVIDLVAKHQLTLETGHSSAEEGLLIVREAARIPASSQVTSARWETRCIPMGWPSFSRRCSKRGFRRPISTSCRRLIRQKLWGYSKYSPIRELRP